MKRRKFLSLMSSAAAWPLAAYAQQPDRVRRIGYITPGLEGDPRIVTWAAAFERGLRELGWTIGHDLQIDYRWDALDLALRERQILEMMERKPEVIVAVTPRLVISLLHETRTIPIVFLDGPESAIGGFVADWSHPGGNVTGFINFVNSMLGKWVQLLKEIAPKVERVAYLFQSDNSNASYYAVGDLDAAARLLNIEVTAAPVRDSAEIEAAITAISAERHGGALVLPGPFVALHRQEIITAANRHGVPVIYPFRYYANDGGLIAYGVDENDLHWRSASYVDRILKGASPGDLPVQAPTRFELVVNAKAAKAIGVEIPQSILLRADDVIE